MTIAIMAAKGGVGKTSIATTLASYLASTGKRILFIDANPQGDATVIYIPDESKEEVLEIQNTLGSTFSYGDNLPIYESKVENLHLVPAHPDMYGSGIPYMKALEEKINTLSYDHIIIDTTNYMGDGLQYSILQAVDKVLLVVSPGSREIQGVETVYNLITGMSAETQPGILGCVLNMYRDNHAATRLTYNELSAHEVYKQFLCKTMIPRCETDNTSQMYGKDSWTFNPKSRFSEAIVRLSEELSL